LLAVDVVVAAACGWVAIRDVVWALRLRRMERDSTGSFEIVGADPTAPTPGLRHIVGRSFGRPEPMHVMRVQTQQADPYRSSRARVPVLSIEAFPTNVRRSLLATAGLLVAFAALLVYCATQMPALAPPHPVECSASPPPLHDPY